MKKYQRSPSQWKKRVSLHDFLEKTEKLIKRLVARATPAESKAL